MIKDKKLKIFEDGLKSLNKIHTRYGSKVYQSFDNMYDCIQELFDVIEHINEFLIEVEDER